MDRLLVRRISRLVAAVLLVVSGRGMLAAQQPDTARGPRAVFAGRIINSLDSTGVSSADIRLVFVDSAKVIPGPGGRDSLLVFADTAKTRVGATDSTGAFTIRRLPEGRYLFDIRRIGYEPLHGAVVVDSTVVRATLAMPVASRLLAKVVITESSVDKVKQRLEQKGFIDRSHLGIAGTFVDRAEILRRRPQTLEDVLGWYGIHGGTITLDNMPIDYEGVRDYPADLVIGVEIYRHSRPTQFNGTRRGPNIMSPGGQAASMEPLVLVWTFIP